jgi:hypothetical protein
MSICQPGQATGGGAAACGAIQIARTIPITPVISNTSSRSYKQLIV